MSCLFLGIIPVLLSCTFLQEEDASVSAELIVFSMVNEKGKNIQERFHPPAGFSRLPADSASFAYWLRHFPLKPHGSAVYYFNGKEKPKKVQEAVLDISVGNRDLQQCADAVMRLRAEYLYSRKNFKEIHFAFTSGFNADYVRWAEGERISVKGNKASWFRNRARDYSYETFIRYLETVFTYAGTLSLARELKTADISDISGGDVFIQGGSPGHAVMVMDVAQDEKGEKVFMIAQSYMPAQNIHVLKNYSDPAISPWYKASEMEKIITPEWVFEKADLRRF